MTHAACDTCERMTFDPKPCVTCVKTDRRSALCSDHRHTCATCGESMCPDHSVRAPLPTGSELRCLDCQPNDETEAREGFANVLRDAHLIDSGRGHLRSMAQLARRLAEVTKDTGTPFIPLPVGRSLESLPRYRGKIS